MFPLSNEVACEQGKRKYRMMNLNTQFLYWDIYKRERGETTRYLDPFWGAVYFPGY